MAERAAYSAYSPFTGTAAVNLDGSESWVKCTGAASWLYSGSGTAYTAFSNDCPYVWNDTFANDQWAQVTFTVVGTGTQSWGLVLRSNGLYTTSHDCYLVYNASGTTYIAKIEGGARSVYAGASAAVTWSGGDVMSAEIEGTVIRVYKNYAGSSDTPVLTYDETTAFRTSGYTGIYHRAGTSDLRYDDFYAGDLSTGGTSVAPLTIVNSATIATPSLWLPSNRKFTY